MNIVLRGKVTIREEGDGRHPTHTEVQVVRLWDDDGAGMAEGVITLHDAGCGLEVGQVVRITMEVAS